MRHPKYILISVFVLFLTVGYSQSQPLSISEAIKQALESNYGISISRSDLDIAMLNNNWGTAGKYPTVSFDAALNTSYDLADNSLSNRASAGIGMNWILFDGFRINVTKSILESTEDLTSGRLAIIIENTIEDIILAYYAVLLEEENLEVLKTVMDLSRDRYDYELKRKSLGSSVTYEVLQAENIFLSDKASFLNQEMQVRNARRILNFILAAEPTASWEYTESFVGDTTHYSLSDLQTKMLSNNQTLKNQYTNLLLKQEEIKLKESAFYPTISTSVGMDNSLSRSKLSSSSAQSFSSYAPYGNLRLSYDIYKGGVRKRALKVAKISQEIEETETAQIEHSLNNELYTLYDYHEVRITLLEVANKSLIAAELNLKISDEKYRAGAINSFNFRDIQLMYLEASLRQLQAVYNLIDSRTRLTRIIGGYLRVEGSGR